MRTLAAILLTAALGWFLGLWLPFWSLSVAGAAVGFGQRASGWRAFTLGCIGGGLLWGGLALMADAANDHVLGTRVGGLFGLGAPAMVGLTALLGAVLAGTGAALGARLRSAR